MNMTLGPQLFAYMFDDSSMMMKQFFKKQNIVKKIKQVLTHLISISIVPDFLFSFLFSCLVYCSSRKVIRLNCWVYRNVTVLISHAVAYLFLSALGGDISSGSYIVSQPQIFTHFYKWSIAMAMFRNSEIILFIVHLHSSSKYHLGTCGQDT